MMVLLTAIKNFRQYGVRKTTSNALPLVDLSSVSVIEDCSFSLLTGIAKDMEVERYHAAFPALGTSAPPSYMEQFDISSIDSRDTESCRMRSCSQSHVTDTGDYGSLKARKTNAYHRLPKNHHLKDKNGHPSGGTDLHYNHGYSKRNSKHQSKSRKVFQDKTSKIDPKLVETCKKTDPKPWKHLDPVVPDTIHTADTLGYEDTSAVDDNEGKISDEIIQFALGEEVVEDEPSKTEFLQNLWSEEHADGDHGEASPWKFDGLTDTSVTVKQTGTTTSFDDCDTTDYSLIEQSMASLQFCEDLPDLCHGSRLAPLFDNDPFSHMILNSKIPADEESVSDVPSAFSCSHCEEAYEVVLDLEMSDSKKDVKHGVLGQIDSRLNFDWCKYHPPPLSTADDDEGVKKDRLCKPYSCGCEFCQSRVWSRTCRICRTPI